MPGGYNELVTEYGLGAGIGVKFNKSYYLKDVSFGQSALSDWSIGIMLGPDSGGGLSIGDMKIKRSGSTVSFSIGSAVSFSADIKDSSNVIPIVIRKVGTRYSIFAWGREIAYQDNGVHAGFSGYPKIESGTEIFSFGTWLQDDYKDVIYMVSGIPVGSGLLFSLTGIYYIDSKFKANKVGDIRSSDEVQVVSMSFPIAVMR